MLKAMIMACAVIAMPAAAQKVEKVEKVEKIERKIERKVAEIGRAHV